MTCIYFVRHAQPLFSWVDDWTRPLTEEGQQDLKIVLDILKDKEIDVFYSSPYKRSVDTIAETAAYFQKDIIKDDRLREREKGVDGNLHHGMFEKRWTDHNYHEAGGESINMVQKRNIAALKEILVKEEGKNVVIGTHSTALGSILNAFDPTFSCKEFLRIIDWMPYVLEMDFEGEELVGIHELGYVEKEFKGK